MQPTAVILAMALLYGVEAAACAGDCDGDGQVAINEAVQGVNIALGNTPVGACAVFDANADGAVTVNELIAAVANVLGGCAAVTPVPTPTATPGPTGDACDALRGEDGITATVNGTVYTYTTVDAFGFPVKPTALVLGGDVELTAGYLERWSLHFPNRVGTYSCSETVEPGNTYVRFLRTDLLGGITTGRGSCTLTATSVGSAWEGRFSGTIETLSGSLAELTGGCFLLHPTR
jgi:hypothetical protein